MWFHYCRVSLMPHWLTQDTSLYLSHTFLIIFFISLPYMSLVLAVVMWCRSQQQLSVRSAYFLLSVCTFINAWVCWRALPSVVSRDTGWLINIIGQHVLMKEPQTGAQTVSLALSSRISSLTVVDEILFPFFSLKICKLPSDKLAFTRKREKMCPGFCGNKMRWR